MKNWLERSWTIIAAMATMTGSMAGIALLCGFMVSAPSQTGSVQTIPLPPGPVLSEEYLFAAHGISEFFFFDPARSRHLWHLKVSRPMGSHHFLSESWNQIPLPDLQSLRRVRDMAYAQETLFLSGQDEKGTPIVRAYPIQQSRTSGILSETISSHTDFYPPSGGAPVRKLLYDPLTHVLWIGYDNGEIEIGPHILVTPKNLILDSPAGYLSLPGKPREGPQELPIIRTPNLPEDRCLTCTLTMVSRKRMDPDTLEIPNIAIRAPRQVGSHLGILPFGNRTLLLRDAHSVACRIRNERNGPSLHPCLTVDSSDIPLAAGASGTDMIFLTAPDGKGNPHFCIVNATYLDSLIQRGAPLKKGFFEQVIRRRGRSAPLPSGAHPFPSFMAESPTGVAIFGRKHLYRLKLFTPSSSRNQGITPVSSFIP
ncbi:MAG: hypothetical protein ACYC9S_10345 [Leptospirales bacterium]